MIIHHDRLLSGPLSGPGEFQTIDDHSSSTERVGIPTCPSRVQEVKWTSERMISVESVPMRCLVRWGGLVLSPTGVTRMSPRGNATGAAASLCTTGDVCPRRRSPSDEFRSS